MAPSAEALRQGIPVAKADLLEQHRDHATASQGVLPSSKSNSTDYEQLAEVFTSAYAETGSVAGALRVLDEYREVARETRLPRIDALELLKATSRHLGIPARTICNSRHRSACEGRWVVGKILRDHGWSLPQIGSFLGTDHSTVFHGLTQITKRPALMGVAREVTESIRRVQARADKHVQPEVRLHLGGG